jgi:tetratricopeptide (TPR) repeat protein
MKGSVPPMAPTGRAQIGQSPVALPETVQRALAAYRRGEYAEAERLCRMVVDAKADYFEALYLLGIIAGRAGRAQDASELLRRALSVNPHSADAHFNRGVALGELGRPEEALESYERAIELRRDYADAYYNRGVVLAELGRVEDAVASYDQAIAVKPDSAKAHGNRGIALSRLQRHADALASYDRAIALKPDNANAHNYRGAALAVLGRSTDALESYDRAIALKPAYAEARNNRGLLLSDLERHADAMRAFESAIALEPGYAEAHYNRGNTLRDLHRHAEAAESFERALALKPDHASAHWNLADCRLLLGDFARGWQEYEWRWKLEQRGSSARSFVQPLWLGSPPPAGSTILLHSELGLGDTLLFCRYARKVAALGARVILEVQQPLVRLLDSLEGAAGVLPTGAALPAFDYHCPLMSLPLAFKTDLSSIPATVPYIRSDAAQVAAWQAKLGPKAKPRVGLVWSGSTRLRNDKRSMRLMDALPLLSRQVEWISLQKEVPESETSLLRSRADIRHFGVELSDFADTAALVELMDLVVTVDTSVANLAGAMGKAVWILIPFNPHDWRWMLEREDSIWYPTARLFRQPAPSDWASVVARVDGELLRWLDAGASATG